MYDYLTELLQDATDNTFTVAMGEDMVLMYRMEDGVLDWSNFNKVQNIKKTQDLW